MALDRLRIFISSPGDVAEERVLATRVVRRLADEYGHLLWIEPIVWEHEPLVATETFQTQIPRPSDCDVVVCILWVRMGTRLPPNVRRADGSTYASGTEYEFEDAAEGHRANGRPELLVYRKTATPLADLRDEKMVLDRLFQKKSLDAFVLKWFFNEDGSTKAAFHSFEKSSEFEQVVEEHLRRLIERRAQVAGGGEKPLRVSWKAGSPFRGLEVFQAEHAPVYFGRSRAISDVLIHMRKQAESGRAFVLILGASGSGKSSLVRAGVLPMLTQPGVVEGIGLWRTAILRPSDAAGDVFLALATALLQPGALSELTPDGVVAADVARRLRQSPPWADVLVKEGLARAAISAARKSGDESSQGHEIPAGHESPKVRLAILVDQLEELFTDASTTVSDRQLFIDVLSRMARSGMVYVLATLRSDFYPRCAELDGLFALKEGAGQYDLALPTPAEIGQMIRQPAQAAGLGFEEDPQTKIPLDEALREVAAANPDSLPLLEFTLEELYARRSDAGLLLWSAYRELGGVEGALSMRAEQIFASLTAPVQAQLPAVFRRLVVAGEDETSIARRQAPLGEFTGDARALVDAFIAARLFTTDRGADSSAIVRIAHEALLRTWPRIKTWLAHDRELLIVRGRVALAAGRWQKEGRSSDLVLSQGKPLDEARGLLAAAPGDLSADEIAFIQASAARARSRQSLKRTAVAALALLALLASCIAVYAFHQRTLAVELRQKADANLDQAASSAKAAVENASAAQRGLAYALVTEGDALRLAGRWEDALQRTQDAYKEFVIAGLSPFPAEIGLWDQDFRFPPSLMNYPGDRVYCLALSPDDRSAISCGQSSSFTLYDIATGTQRHTFKGHTAAVKSVAFSPDGRFAISGSEDKTMKLWDIATGKEIRTFSGHTSWVQSVAFSPDGATVLSGGGDKIMKLWDIASGQELKTFSGHTESISDVAFSPDGRTALSGSVDGTLKLWDIASGENLRTISGYAGGSGGSCAAFSPDGSTILGTSHDKSMALWDVATGAPLRTFWGHKDFVDCVGFSHDGGTAISGGWDKTIKLWDVATGRELRSITGDTAYIQGVCLSRDGRFALSGDWNGTLTLWDLVNSREIRSFAGHTHPVNEIAISPDGRTALSCSDDNTMRLWDIATGKELQTFSGHTDWVEAVAYSPDGRTALSASQDKTLKLWDLGTGAEIRTFTGHTYWVQGVAFSPDGRTALSACYDNTVKLWDVSTGKELRTFVGHTNHAVCVTFSADGRTAVSGGWDGAILWDVATGKQLRTFTVDGGVHSIAISPDGNTLLACCYDDMLRLWDINSGKLLRTFKGHNNPVMSVSFSPDGRTALSGSTDDTMKLWDIATGTELRSFNGHGYYFNSVAFGPDGHWALIGSQDKTLKLYDFNVVQTYHDLQPKVEAAQTTLTTNPTDAMALGVLGQWWAFRGYDDWAVEDLEKARAGGAPVSNITLARSYWNLHKLPQATKEFLVAMSAATDPAEKFYIQLCLRGVEAEALAKAMN